MFKHTQRLCTKFSFHTSKSILRQEIQRVSMSNKSVVETTEKWDLVSAVCLERHPIIIKPMNETEAKFGQLLNQLELENSMKSDHELRIEKDKKEEDLIKTGALEVDIGVVIQTAQDFEDASLDEFKKFHFAPRITEADKKNDITSLDRKLDRHLVLLVHQKLGEHSYWIPPQGIRRDGETLRQTAERVLKEACGEDLKAKFYGNAPCGFYKYKYPIRIRKSGAVGAKVFYYQAKYLSGSWATKAKYQWLDREELHQTLPDAVKNDIFQFLVNED
ncbi:39S ribosomal protein L46, mitochondrial [Athalia rosae]|uniref:39S ribosomal protein L46, mitochondrial n=1 Tax=Athalia rosae TaxID=37344 RepID=UPI002033A907|nr:39S ribosomal protein L46, mitochondrial [Athalia rosae]